MLNYRMQLFVKSMQAQTSVRRTTIFYSKELCLFQIKNIVLQLSAGPRITLVLYFAAIPVWFSGVSKIISRSLVYAKHRCYSLPLRVCGLRCLDYTVVKDIWISFPCLLMLFHLFLRSYHSYIQHASYTLIMIFKMHDSLICHQKLKTILCVVRVPILRKSLQMKTQILFPEVRKPLESKVMSIENELRERGG